MPSENFGTSRLIEEVSDILDLERNAGLKGAAFILGTSKAALQEGLNPEKVENGIVLCKALLAGRLSVSESINESREKHSPLMSKILESQPFDDDAETMSVTTDLSFGEETRE